LKRLYPTKDGRTWYRKPTKKQIETQISQGKKVIRGNKIIDSFSEYNYDVRDDWKFILDNFDFTAIDSYVSEHKVSGSNVKGVTTFRKLNSITADELLRIVRIKADDE